MAEERCIDYSSMARGEILKMLNQWTFSRHISFLVT
jgi:hypothetical protein